MVSTTLGPQKVLMMKVEKMGMKASVMVLMWVLVLAQSWVLEMGMLLAMS